jgi:hypothetical protein
MRSYIEAILSPTPLQGDSDYVCKPNSLKTAIVEKKLIYLNVTFRVFDA